MKPKQSHGAPAKHTGIWNLVDRHESANGRSPQFVLLLVLLLDRVGLQLGGASILQNTYVK